MDFIRNYNTKTTLVSTKVEIEWVLLGRNVVWRDLNLQK